MNIFEKATKQKFRFETAKGDLTVEDLWDMPLEGAEFSLDSLAKTLDQKMNSSSSTSFVTKKPKKDQLVSNKFKIVLAVIERRLAEKEAASIAAQRKDKAQRIMAIIERKRDEALEGQSMEDLEKTLRELSK